MGILQGNLAWYGNFDQCRAIHAVWTGTDKTTSHIDGQYCLASFGTMNIEKVRHNCRWQGNSNTSENLEYPKRIPLAVRFIQSPNHRSYQKSSRWTRKGVFPYLKSIHLDNSMQDIWHCCNPTRERISHATVLRNGVVADYLIKWMQSRSASDHCAALNSSSLYT